MFRLDYADLTIFSGLDAHHVSQLSPYMIESHFLKDQVIFQQGQPAENLYILITGEVVIHYKPYDGPPLTVARIEPGGVFGWSSALARDVYTSGATAVEDSCVLRIRGANLHELCQKYPETGMVLLDRLAGVIAERLRNTHTEILGILSQGCKC